MKQGRIRNRCYPVSFPRGDIKRFFRIRSIYIQLSIGPGKEKIIVSIRFVIECIISSQFDLLTDAESLLPDKMMIKVAENLYIKTMRMQGR